MTIAIARLAVPVLADNVAPAQSILHGNVVVAKAEYQDIAPAQRIQIALMTIVMAAGAPVRSPAIHVPLGMVIVARSPV